MPGFRIGGRTLFAALAAMLLSAAPAAATTDFTLTTFEAGGRTHVLRYANEREHAVQPVLEAVEHVFSVYQPLWGGVGGATKSAAIPFQFYVLLSFEAPGGTAADALMVNPATLPEGAVATADQVCRINIYNYIVTPDLLYVMAHEMAHCYQDYYIPASSNFSVLEERWWVEGSAEWMALLAYPETQPVSVRGYKEYVVLHTHHEYLFAGAYDTAFFWEFLASPTGLGSVQAAIEFLRAMPTATSTVIYEDYLRGAVADVDVLLHNYAVAIGRKTTLHAPGAADTGFNLNVVGPLPDESAVNTDPFSIDFHTFRNLPLVPENGGVLFEAINLENSGIRASILLTSGTYPLLPGAPVLVCAPYWQDYIVAISRSDPTPFGGEALIRLTASEPHACDGDADKPTPAGMALIPDCLAGNWRIIELPPDLEMFGGDITNHVILWRLEGDGDYTIDFSITATTPGASTIIHAAIAGHLGLVPSQVRGNSYDVVGATASIVPGTATGVVQVGGIQVDAGPILNTIFTDVGNLIPYPSYLTCTGDATMDYVALFNGADQIWRMLRL